MLKKTAAMAVLVLVIASLFSGSPGLVQADVPAKNDVAEYTHDFHLTTLLALHTGKAVTSGTFGAAGGTAAAADTRVAGFAGDSPDAGITFAGIPAGAGMVVTGPVSSFGPGPDQAYTEMVIYMNESGIKMPMFSPGMSPDKANSFRVISHKTPGPSYEPGALSLNGKVAMFKTGSARPDIYDLRWENMQAVRFGEKMSPAIFSAHLVIPHANGSEVMPLPEWPFPGEYVLDSNVSVDLTNLTLAGGVTSQDSVYNNTIDAGETQWHSADISGAVKSVNFDLKWRDGSSPLKLTIYTPDGHILGPYDDSSDGKTDSRINLNVDNPSGVAAGEWSMKVTDTGVNGTGGYYLKTY